MAEQPVQHRWEDLEALLVAEATDDLERCCDTPHPVLVAYAGDHPRFFAWIRSFPKGEYHDAMIELLALAMPLGADRLVLSMSGRLWSFEDPIPPVCDDVDLRQRALVLLVVDGSKGRPTVNHRLLPFDVVDGGVQWGEAQDMGPGEGWLTDVLRLSVVKRDEFRSTDARIAKQLRRCEWLGHELWLPPSLIERLTPHLAGDDPDADRVPVPRERLVGPDGDRLIGRGLLVRPARELADPPGVAEVEAAIAGAPLLARLSRLGEHLLGAGRAPADAARSRLLEAAPHDSWPAGGAQSFAFGLLTLADLAGVVATQRSDAADGGGVGGGPRRQASVLAGPLLERLGPEPAGVWAELAATALFLPLTMVKGRGRWWERELTDLPLVLLLRLAATGTEEEVGPLVDILVDEIACAATEHRLPPPVPDDVVETMWTALAWLAELALVDWRPGEAEGPGPDLGVVGPSALTRVGLGLVDERRDAAPRRRAATRRRTRARRRTTPTRA